MTRKTRKEGRNKRGNQREKEKQRETEREGRKTISIYLLVEFSLKDSFEYQRMDVEDNNLRISQILQHCCKPKEGYEMLWAPTHIRTTKGGLESEIQMAWFL